MNQKRNIRFLTIEEINKIIATCEDNAVGRKDRALLELLFSTGMRISEALGLKVEDILRLNPDLKTKIKTLEMNLIGKGGVQRTVYISPQAVKALVDYLSKRRKTEDNRLFCVGPRGVQLMVKVRAKKAGVDKFVSPHTWRHSMACHFLKNGVSIFHIQRFLGHKNLNTSMVYLHATDWELKKIHEKIYK